MRFSCAAGTLILPFLLREMASADGACDVVSPYDFGGYLFTTGSDAEATLSAFMPHWLEWCRQNRVVSEFLRIHPLRPWNSAVAAVAEVHQEQVIVDLSSGYDAVRSQYSENARRSIRKAEQSGAQARKLEGESVAADFHRLYALAMRRLGAPRFYDFPERFFAELLRYPEVSVWGVASPAGGVLATALFIDDGPDRFYFLGASDYEGWPMRPNHLLFDTVFRISASSGRRWMHLGGGAESLMRFKRSFSHRTVPFHVRRFIHDDSAYRRLVDAMTPSERQARPGHFPLYRAAEYVALARSETPGDRASS